ncbi:uncharacterized protein LOC143925641 [Lithobates pipiens]
MVMRANPRPPETQDLLAKHMRLLENTHVGGIPLQKFEKEMENNGFKKIWKPSRTRCGIYIEEKIIVKGPEGASIVPTAKVVSPQLTLKEKLLKTLEELKQEQFENFKMCLRDEEFLSRNDYDSMRTSELENKNRMEVSELLIRRYTKKRALPLTILVLEGIGEKQLAKNLRAYLDAKTLENIDANIP